MPTLYEISTQFQQIECELVENEGELSPELEKFLTEMVAQREEKLEGYGRYIAEVENRAAARKAEAARLSALAKRDEGITKLLKDRLLKCFQVNDWKKVETPSFSFTLANNGGALPMIVNPEWELDPAKAPEQFHKIAIQIDREAIREALRNDEKVPGCAMAERGQHLRIR